MVFRLGGTFLYFREVFLSVFSAALKGRNRSAQGNALGYGRQYIFKPCKGDINLTIRNLYF